MKTNELFLLASRDKQSAALLVSKSNDGKMTATIVVNVKNKYDNNTEMKWIPTDTEIRVENYSNSSGGKYREVTHLHFNESIWHIGPCKVETFLSRIKKDSEVYFRVIAYNGSQWSNSKGIVRHELYGIINNCDAYLLSVFVGDDNEYTPVNGYRYNS